MCLVVAAEAAEVQATNGWEAHVRLAPCARSSR